MRITELQNGSLQPTDYLAVDDATMGTRKLLVSDAVDGLVSYADAQTLDATEQSRARTNIGAASTAAASTSAAGLVQLYDGVDSSSTTLAATAASAKAAYDKSVQFYKNVVVLGLTSGSATIAGVFSAMADNSLGWFEASQFASGQTPNTFGFVEIHKIGGSRASVHFWGKAPDNGDYRMGINNSNVPDGTWVCIGGETTADFVRNENYTTAANNLIKFRRVGQVVTMHGSIYPTAQVPAYTSVGTIPSGFRPANNVSLLFIPSTQTVSPYWVYAGTDGACSMQSIALPANVSYYVTATYISK